MATSPPARAAVAAGAAAARAKPSNAAASPAAGAAPGGAGAAAAGPHLRSPDWRKAQETAAQLRAECEVLRGAPRDSSTNPHFMDEFFKASRLHFIGTWRTRIEALMAEWLQSASNHPTPAAPAAPTTGGGAKGGSSSGLVRSPGSLATSISTPERVVIHVDMDAFFASAAAAGHPELAGKPLVVCHSNSASGTGEMHQA